MEAPRQDADGLYEASMQVNAYHEVNASYFETGDSAPMLVDAPAPEETAATGNQENPATPVAQFPDLTHEVEAPQPDGNTNEVVMDDSDDSDDSSAGSNNDIPDENAPEGVDDAGHETEDSQEDIEFFDECNRTCEPHFLNRRQVAYSRKREIKRLRVDRERRTRAHRALITRLRRQLAEARQRRDRRPKKTKTTWREQLRRSQLGLENIGYRKIFIRSCNEENTSTRLHPLLKLIPPCNDEEKTTVRPETHFATRDSRKAGKGKNQRGQANNSKDAEYNDQVPESDHPVRRKNPFQRLNLDMVVRILHHVLVFDGQLVHAISRLDEYKQPNMSRATTASAFATDSQAIQLLRRFHIGSKPVNLTHALHPRQVLAPLLGRFAKGIGNRLQRVQQISLFWIGSQDVCHKINERGKYTSRRTEPLSWLPETIRLKTVEIYVRESHEQHRRRRHEPRGQIRFLKEHTLSQPDFRLMRDLYHLQGLDNVKCLRGLFYIQFWDYDAFLTENKVEVSVRNHDFVAHINELVGRMKKPDKARLAEFENLAPLGIQYLPRNEEVEYIKRAITIFSEEDRPGPPPPSVGHVPDDPDQQTVGDDWHNGDDGDDDDDDDTPEGSDIGHRDSSTHGTAAHGTAAHGTAAHGTATHGTATLGTAAHGTAAHGTTTDRAHTVASDPNSDEEMADPSSEDEDDEDDSEDDGDHDGGDNAAAAVSPPLAQETSQQRPRGSNSRSPSLFLRSEGPRGAEPPPEPPSEEPKPEEAPAYSFPRPRVDIDLTNDDDNDEDQLRALGEEGSLFVGPGDGDEEAAPLASNGDGAWSPPGDRSGCLPPQVWEVVSDSSSSDSSDSEGEENASVNANADADEDGLKEEEKRDADMIDLTGAAEEDSDDGETDDDDKDVEMH